MGAREERICWPGGSFGSDLEEPVVEGSSTKEMHSRYLPQAEEPGDEIVAVAEAHEVRYSDLGLAGKDRVGGGQGEGRDTRTEPTGHSFRAPPVQERNPKERPFSGRQIGPAMVKVIGNNTLPANGRGPKNGHPFFQEAGQKR